MRVASATYGNGFACELREAGVVAMAVVDPSRIGGGCGGSEPTMTTTEAETETDITVARRGGAHRPPLRPRPNVPMTKTTTAAIRRRPPPHMMLVFSRFSPKKVSFEDTTEAVVALVSGGGMGGGAVRLPGWLHAPPGQAARFSKPGRLTFIQAAARFFLF